MRTFFPVRRVSRELLFTGFLLQIMLAAFVTCKVAHALPQPPQEYVSPAFANRASWVRPNFTESELSPDFKLLATVVGREIWLLRTSNCSLVHKLKAFAPNERSWQANPTEIVFSTDGSLIGARTTDESAQASEDRVSYSTAADEARKAKQPIKPIAGIVAVWRVHDGKPLWRVQKWLRDPKTRGKYVRWNATFSSFDLHQNGSAFVSWGNDYAALWHITNGRVTQLKPVVAPPATTRWKWRPNWEQSVFSPDGRWLINGGYPLQFWRVAGNTFRAAHTVETGEVEGFSADGRLIATESDGNPYSTNVFRVADGKLLWQLKGGAYDPKNFLAFSSNGQLIVLREGKVGGSSSLVVRKALDGQIVRAFKATGERAWFSRDNRILATEDDGSFWFWRVADSRLIRALGGHHYSVSDVAFNQSRQVASSASDHVHVASANGQTQQVLQAPENGIGRIEYSKSGRYLLSGNDGSCGDDRLYLWRTSDWKQLWVQQSGYGPSGVSDLAFSPDEKRVAIAGNGGLFIRRVVDGKTELAIRGENFTCVSFSYDGQQIVSGNSEGLVVWNARDGSLLRRWPQKNGVIALALCPSSQRAAIITGGANLKLIHLQDGALLWQHALPHDTLRYKRLFVGGADVAFFKDGRIVACAGGKAVVIYRARDGQALQQLDSPLGGVQRLALSSDNAQLLAACRSGVAVWRSDFHTTSFSSYTP